jgi:L-fuconolactonase
VVAVNVNSPDAVATLQRLHAEGAVGVRLRPTDRSAGDNPLAIWHAADALGLVVSCVGNSQTFGSPEFAAMVAGLPNLVIVLEHLGSTSSPDADEAAVAARLGVFELAKYPNICIKLPGLGEILPRPALMAACQPGAPCPSVAVLQAAFAAFGSQRLLWGSDFPVVSSREGYGHALAVSRSAIHSLAPKAMPLVFGENARRLFVCPPLGDTP